MRRYPVESSSIASVGYNPSSETLEIEYISGGVYQYKPVPWRVYENLRTAPSKGKYAHEAITRNKDYTVTKVEDCQLSVRPVVPPMTHTYALLEVSPLAWSEIAFKLRKAGYEDAFHAPGPHERPGTSEVIDMTGIAVTCHDETKTAFVLSEVLDERVRQDDAWGGPEHDDQHVIDDWVDLIDECLLCLKRRGGRDEFLKIAALAVAAMESLDRKAAVALEDAAEGRTSPTDEGVH